LMWDLNQTSNFQIYSIGLGGLFTTEFTANRQGDLKERGKEVLKYIKKHGRRGDIMILTNQLMTWFSSTYNDRLEDHRLILRSEQLDQYTALRAHARNIEEIAVELKGLGMNLVILSPFPDFKFHPNECYYPLKKYLSNFNVSSKCTTTRSDQEARRKNIVSSLEEISRRNNNVYIFDPIDFVCGETMCESYKNGNPIYSDDDHINFNLSRMMFGAFSALLADINRDK
jgi:hypothetical protein